jgi:hypothetical protein
MALRISLTFEEHYQVFKAAMRHLRSDLIGPTGTGGIYVALETRAVSWEELYRLLLSIRSGLVEMDAAVALGPDFVQYVKDQERDQNYDVAADFQTMRAAVIAIRDWIITNMPKQSQAGTDWWLVLTVDADGVKTNRTFTTVQTAPLLALIDTYRATVA